MSIIICFKKESAREFEEAAFGPLSRLASRASPKKRILGRYLDSSVPLEDKNNLRDGDAFQAFLSEHSKAKLVPIHMYKHE